MSKKAIIVDQVSKRYNLMQKRAPVDQSLREVFSGGIRKAFASRSEFQKQDFWALQDISFEIQQGDRVGIVGRNGAGKSTLLKILSRIVKPTTGRIDYYGKMASLLEVGTGFHGDLSGRENIYLNGSILGMSKAEITAKFDEIVAFSEIEQFLDTPVKRYSSGMYVRLAFAVAAHLEPEILIVDEVLAVGDAAFQKKCIGKMSDISNREGKTILFVSHSMQAVQKICNTGIFLQKGRLIEQNTIDQIVNRYLQSSDGGKSVYEIPEPAEKLPAHVYRVEMANETGEVVYEIPVGTFWKSTIFFRIEKEMEHFIMGFGIVSSLDMPIRTSWTQPSKMEPGEYSITFKNNDLLLNPGIYKIVIGLSEHERTFQYIDDVVSMTISDAGATANNSRIVNTQSGLILNPMDVEIRKI
jgi:lipopolysaccharide transport system ATP-binding protein